MTAPAVKHACALWTVELMRRHGQHVYILLINVYMKRAGSLDRICVEQHACLAAYPADLLYRLYGSDLVVCVHDRNESGILAYSVLYRLSRYAPVLVNRQVSHVKPLAFERLCRVQYRMVLYLARNKVLFALRRQAVHSAFERPVIRLRAA